ncbi:MAG: hypothetical protein JOZ36_00380 [Acidobacteria bacterium]|nr:hypothetical protein [Acidobacteriota bacterium]
MLDLLHDFFIQLQNLLFEKSQVLHTEADHLAVMIAHAMFFQGSNDGRNLLFGATFSELGNLLWLCFALQQCLQHQLTRYSKEV